MGSEKEVAKAVTKEQTDIEKKLESMMIKIERPNPGEKAEEVELSATVMKGEEQIVQKFKLKINPWTHPEVVNKNMALLTNEFILNGNADLDHIISDLYFPKTGQNGAKIEWSSENKAIVSDEGKVTRPAYVKGDITLNITALVTSDKEKASKVFKVTVIKKEQTTQEYLESLWDSIVRQVLNGNADKDHLTQDLYLPQTEAGTSIVMTSNDTSHVTNEGKVKRPKSTEGNSSVQLSFTIKKGDTQITRELNVVVLATDKEVEK